MTHRTPRKYSKRHRLSTDAAEAHHQSAAVAASAQANDDQEFIDALAEDCIAQGDEVER